MTTPGRALAWVVAAGLLLAGGTALSIGVAARQQLRQSELVLLVTADGDGHLTGLPLMRGGVRPLGGLRRLRAAVSKELSYFPSARVVSAGGDIGTFDEDNDLLATSEALASIAPQGVTPGLSELEVCDELVTNPITFVSANVVHPMIDLPYLTLANGSVTSAITGVSQPQLIRSCPSASFADPHEALARLIDRHPEIDSWVVLAHLGGPPAVDLAQQLSQECHRVIAVISSGSRDEAGSLPYEPPGNCPVVVFDAGREWRQLLVVRLVYDRGTLLSYEGSRRIPLDDRVFLR